MRKQRHHSKFIIFASLLFSLESCTFIHPSTPEIKYDYDQKQYLNYQRMEYFEKDKDSIEIDFLKDVFPEGILVDRDGNKTWIADCYDGVEVFKDIANFNGFSVDSEYFSKEEATFKIKIERKQFASVIAPIDFCFINTKTHIRSNRMRLGYFGFRKNAKNIVYINSTDDIQRVKDSTIAVLNTDIDYDEYFKDKKEKGYLFPEFDHGIFLNPFRHVIRNLTYEVENVTADVNYSGNLEGFHVVTSNCLNSRFSGIQGRNINVTANKYGGVSFLSGITVRCDIINNKMEGTITNNYSKENRYGFAGGLCGSIILNNFSYHYSEYNFYEIDELLETLKYRHSIFSIVTGNIINADITAADIAGGITGYCDYPDAIRMNAFSGKLTAKKTGEYNGGNYFLQLND